MKCCVKHVIFLLEIVSAQIRKALYGSTGSEKHDQNHYRGNSERSQEGKL